jgi:hypothetical protein
MFGFLCGTIHADTLLPFKTKIYLNTIGIERKIMVSFNDGETRVCFSIRRKEMSKISFTYFSSSAQINQIV